MFSIDWLKEGLRVFLLLLLEKGVVLRVDRDELGSKTGVKVPHPHFDEIMIVANRRRKFLKRMRHKNFCTKSGLFFSEN